VLVGCGVDTPGVGSGGLCSDEHDRRRNAKGIANRNSLVFIKRVLISLLLADRILQNSQSFDFNDNFIAVLQFTDTRRCTCEDQITRLKRHHG